MLFTSCFAARVVKPAFRRVKVGAGGGATDVGSASCPAACDEMPSLLLWPSE